MNELESRLNSLERQVESHDVRLNNLRGDGNIRVEGGQIGLNRKPATGPRGPNGLLGPSGASGQSGPTGLSGVYSASGPSGPPGPGGGPGTMGTSGPSGPTGLSAKSSVVATELGNVAFSCLEGSRPTLWCKLVGTSQEPIRIPAELIASVVPGSLFVWSIVPNIRTKRAANIIDCHVHITADPEAICTIIVGGVDKRFPGEDWHLRTVSDAQQEHSTRWWAQEWKPYVPLGK